MNSKSAGVNASSTRLFPVGIVVDGSALVVEMLADSGHFALETKPVGQSSDDRNQFWVEVAVTAADLDSAADEWDKALSVFPDR